METQSNANGLLLLDEPEAHLHNATTARFLNDKDCDSGRFIIFQMDRDALKPEEISMQFLSQSLVSVCEPLCNVFCEAENDVNLYDALFRRFLKLPYCLHKTDAILMFKSGVGKKTKPDDDSAAAGRQGQCLRVCRGIVDPNNSAFNEHTSLARTIDELIPLTCIWSTHGLISKYPEQSPVAPRSECCARALP